MDPAVWSKLPAELLEQMLSFLLVPDLCRFRVVCRRWNNLIRSPEFGKLSTLNAIRSAQRGAYLVVKLRKYRPGTRCGREVPGWSIFDLNEKRWYCPEHDSFLSRDSLFERRHVLSMDGGLVCAFVTSFPEQQPGTPNGIRDFRTGSHQKLIMFNLFGGASKVIPNPPLVNVHLNCLKLKLVVENTSNTFKIVLINIDWCIRRNPRNPFLSVYESSTDQWRSTPEGPVSVNPQFEMGYPLSNAIFQGLLYILFVLRGDVQVLLSFNFLEDSWKDTGVQFPRSQFEGCDLVVSDNRLFLMTLLPLPERTRKPCLLDISEVLLVDKECRTVVRKEETFDHETRAFGFNKSILVMRSRMMTSKMMLYNLETGQWESLPQSLPQNSLALQEGTIRWLEAQTNYLQLPGAPW